MTGTVLIASLIRPAVSDALTPYRWTDAKITGYVNSWLRALWRLHPEAFTVSAIVTDPPSTITEAGLVNELPVLDIYEDSGFHFVCGRMLGEDSEDAANQNLAAQHYSAAGLGM